MSVPTIKCPKCSSQYIPPLPCFSVNLLQQGWYQMSSHFSALLLCLVCRWSSSCLVLVDQHHFVVMLGFAARMVSDVQPFLCLATLPCLQVELILSCPCRSASICCWALQQGWYQMSSHFSALLLCLVCRWSSSCLVHVDQHQFVVGLCS